MTFCPRQRESRCERCVELCGEASGAGRGCEQNAATESARVGLGREKDTKHRGLRCLLCPADVACTFLIDRRRWG